MDEQAFEALAGATLERWAEVIEDGCDDVDVDCDGSVLTVELEDGRIFIVNRHRPLKQIWLSSPISGASHYDWNESEKAWAATRSDDRLHHLLAREVSDVTGASIALD